MSMYVALHSSVHTLWRAKFVGRTHSGTCDGGTSVRAIFYTGGEEEL
jgi:hypothetical protein